CRSPDQRCGAGTPCGFARGGIVSFRMFFGPLSGFTYPEARIGPGARYQSFEAGVFHFGIRIQQEQEFTTTLPRQKVYTAREPIVAEGSIEVSGERQLGDFGHDFGSGVMARSVVENVKLDRYRQSPNGLEQAAKEP